MTIAEEKRKGYELLATKDQELIDRNTKLTDFTPTLFYLAGDVVLDVKTQYVDIVNRDKWYEKR